MSREIDERIVQMKFDNTLFERNVATSIGTLEKLKSALDFSGATDSLNSIERNINRADFSKLASSIETISNRFSNWGIVGMTVIQDLTRAAENLGGKLLNMTIGGAFSQIKTGGWTRATNIDKAKFAIEGLGYAWDDLKDSINNAVNETRFGFDEAASAASQLVASNVAIGEEMDNALKSIANVASQTGDEYSSIAHIYTTIAGNGKLMTEQLNMFSYRGLNAAALIAKSMGKTEQEIREMTSKGEISFKQFSDAMNDALGEGAKRANETFEGSLANMNAALKRIGQPFAETIRKYMPPVFNELKDTIKQIKEITDTLVDPFENVFMHMTNSFRYVLKNLDLTPLKNLASLVSDLIYQFDLFIGKISPIWAHIDSDLELLSKPIKEAANYYSSFASMLLDKQNVITKIPTSALEAIKKVSKEADASYDSLAATILRRRDKLFGIPTSAFEEMKKIAKDANKYFEEMTVLDEKSTIKKLREEVTSHYDAVKDGIPVGLDTGGLLYWIVEITNEGKKTEQVISEIAERFQITTEDAAKGVKIVHDVMEPTGKLLETTRESIDKTSVSMEHIDEVAKKVLAGVYGNGQARIDKLREEDENWQLIQNRVNELSGSTFRYEIEEEKVTRTTRRYVKEEKKRQTVLEAITDMMNALTEKVREFANTIDRNSVIKRLATIINGVKDGLYVVVRIFSIFVNAALKPTLNFLSAIGDVILNTWAAIAELTSEFRAFVDASEILIDLEGSLNFIFGMISNLGQSILSIFYEVTSAIGAALIKVNGFTLLYSVVDLVMSLSEKVIEVIDEVKSTMDKDDITEKIGSFLNGIINGLSMIIRFTSVVLNAAMKPFLALVLTIGETLLDCAAAAGEWVTNLRNLAIESGFFEKVEIVLNKIFWFLSGIGQNIVKGFGSAFKSIDKFLSNILGNIIERLKSTFSVFGDTDVFKRLKKSIADLKYDFNQLRIKGTQLIKKVFKGFGKSNVKLPTGPFELLLSVITRVSDVASRFISWVVDKVDVDKLLKNVAVLIEKMNQALKIFGKIIGGVVSTAIKGVVSLFKGFVKVAGALADAISDLWGMFKDSKAFKALNDGFDKVKSVVANVKDRIVDLFTNDETGEFEFPEINWDSIKKAWLSVWKWVKGRIIAAKGFIEKKISEITGTEFHFPELNLEPIKKRLEGLKDWFVDLFTNDETGEFELPIEAMKEKLESVKDWFFGLFTDPTTGEVKFSWEGVKKGFGDVVGWFREKIDELKALIDEVFGKSGEEGSSEGESLPLFDRIKKGVEDFIAWITEKIDAVKSTLIGFFSGKDFDEANASSNSLPDISKILPDGAIDEDDGENHPILKFLWNLVKALTGLAADAVLTGLDVIDRLIVILEQHLPTISGILSGAIDNILTVCREFIDELSGNDDLQSKIDYISGVITKVGNLVLKFKAFKAIFGVLDFFSNIGGTIKSIQEAVDTFKKLIKNVTKTMKASTRALNALAILELAGAVLAMAGAFKLLGSLTWDQFKVAAACIGVITGALVILFKTLNVKAGGAGGKLVNEPLIYLVDSLRQFGVGLNKALRKLGTAAMIMAFAYAVKKIIDIVKDLTDFNWADGHAGVEMMSLVIGEIVGAIKAINLGNGKKTFGNQLGVAAELIALAIAVKSIANTLITLSDVPAEKLAAAEKAINNIMWLAMKLTLLGGNDKYSMNDGTGKGPFGMHVGNRSSSKRNTKWKTILATAAIIWTVGNTLTKLANCDEGKLDAATKAVTSVMNACIGILAAASFITDEKSSSVYANEGNGKGLFGMHVGHKAKQKKASDINKAFKNILIVMGLIAAVAIAVGVLAHACEPEKLEAASEAISAVVGVCIGLLAASAMIADGDSGHSFDGETWFGNNKKTGKFNKSQNVAWKNLLGIIGIIAAVGTSLYFLGHLDPAKLEAAGNAMAKVANVCIGLILATALLNKGDTSSAKGSGLFDKLFKKSKGTENAETSTVATSKEKASSVWASFVPIVTAILATAFAIYMLKDVNPATIIAAATAITMVALACTGIMLASGVVSKLSNGSGIAQQWNTAATELATVGGSIFFAYEALKFLTQLDTEPEKLEAAGSALFKALSGIAIAMLASSALTLLGGPGGIAALVIAGIAGIIAVFESIEDVEIFGFKPFGGKGATDAAIERITEGFRAIGGMINAFVSGLLGTENVGKDIEQGANNVAEDVGSGVGSLGDSIASAIEGIKNANPEEIITTFGEAFKKIPGILFDFTTDFKKFTDLAKTINKEDTDALGATLLALVEMIGVDAIGGLVESLVGEDGGITAMAKKLNGSFMTDFQGFLSKAKELNEDVDALNALSTLLDVLNDIAIKDIVTAGLEWLVGKVGGEDGGLVGLVNNLPLLAEAMIKYSTALEEGNINTTKMLRSAKAAKALVEVANAAPKTGGILQKILGEADMKKFAVGCVYFIVAMVDASDALKGKTIDEAGIHLAAIAGGYLNDLAWSIPREGGYLQKIIGKKDIAAFGEKCVAFIESIITASNSLEGVSLNESAFETAANCGTYLQKLESSLPAQDGKLQKWIGEQNIKDFGARLVSFGRSMAKFNRTITKANIDTGDDGAIAQVAALGTLFAELEKTLPESGSVVAKFFEGEQSIDDFGKRLRSFGESMVGFSDVISGNADGFNNFDNKVVSAAVDTLNHLWEFVEKVNSTAEGEEGILDYWTAMIDAQDVFGAILDFYQNLGNGINSEDAFNDSGVLESCKEAGETLAKAIVNGLKSGLSDVNEKTGQSPLGATLYKTVIKGLGNEKFIENVVNKGEDIGKALLEGFETILTEDNEEGSLPAFAKDVLWVFEDMIYNIFLVMTNCTPNFKTRAEAWMNSIKNAINLHRGTIIGSLLGIATTVLNNYGLRNPDFYSAGANWMTSLSNGISNNMNSVIELAQSVADQVSSIINNATNKASTASKGIGSFTDAGGVTSFTKSSPMLTQMSTIADAGLRSANTLSKAMDTATSNGEMNFMQLQSLASFQNGAANLTRDMGSSMSMASQSIGRASSLFSSASSSEPATSEVYVKNNTETLEALNGMRRDIKVLTENMANMQMVLDSGVLVGQLTPGMNVSLNQRMKFKGRWA